MRRQNCSLFAKKSLFCIPTQRMGQTVYNCVNHIYWVLLISGFLSFSYNAETKTFKSIGLIHRLLVFGIFVILALIFYTLNFTGIVYEHNQFLNVLMILYHNSLLFKVYSAALCSKIYQSEILESWKHLLNFDEEFQKFGIKLRYSRIKFLPYVIILPQIACKWFVEITFIEDYSKIYGKFGNLLYAMYLSTDFVITTIRLLHITLGLLFANYYIELNERVNEILRERQGFESREFSYLGKNEIVNLACKFHLELSHICKSFTRIFAPVMIAFFVDSFYLCTVHLYNVISKFYDSNNTKEWRTTVGYSVYWIVECVFTLGSFVVPAEYCLRSVSLNFCPTILLKKSYFE